MLVKANHDFSTHFLPLRNYQSEVKQCAKDRNAICLMGTGSGKTMIAVHIIKEFLEKNDKEIDDWPTKKVVFLAPTVVIVQQQYDLICNSVPYRAGSYYEDVSIPVGNEGEWVKDFETKDIFVMVPEIFDQVLSKGWFDLSRIGLVIFDECHHCTKFQTSTKKESHHPVFCFNFCLFVIVLV
jgi:endoribonuclease Dicer